MMQMIREGSNPLHDNIAAALLFRPIEFKPVELREISVREKRVFPDAVWKFISKNNNCSSRDVANFFECTIKVATEHVGKLHKNNRVIRRGTKGKYTYEAIK